MEKPSKWPTFKWAGYGGLAGALYGLWANYEPVLAGGDYTAYGLGRIFGVAFGGAVLVAMVSGVRNLFVR